MNLPSMHLEHRSLTGLKDHLLQTVQTTDSPTGSFAIQSPWSPRSSSLPESVSKCIPCSSSIAVTPAMSPPHARTYRRPQVAVHNSVESRPIDSHPCRPVVSGRSARQFWPISVNAHRPSTTHTTHGQSIVTEWAHAVDGERRFNQDRPLRDAVYVVFLTVNGWHRDGRQDRTGLWDCDGCSLYPTAVMSATHNSYFVSRPVCVCMFMCVFTYRLAVVTKASSLARSLKLGHVDLG